MIQSLDPVGPGPRLDPAFLQGRGPVIDAEQARLLGLRNGQVVQAVIDDSATAFSVMWPAGQRQGLPSALQAFPLPSQWRWAAGSTQDLMAMLMPGGHIMLKPLRSGAGASAASPAPGSAGTAAGAPAAGGVGHSTGTLAAGAPGGALGGAAAALARASVPVPGVSWVPREPPAAYTLGQAFAAALGAAGSSSSAEVARLMQQAPAWAGLIRLLQGLDNPADSADDTDANASPSAPLLAPRLSEVLGGALPRMAGLTPAALQQAMMRSGLGTEAALLAGSLGLDQDLKVALRRLMRSAATVPGSAGDAGWSRAVDTLERSQLDSLTAQMQGQVLLAMVIPFADAGPVGLRITRERPRAGEEPPPFVVDVHSAHSGLGPLWLRTQVAQDQRVSITMWALRDEVAQQARARAPDLRRTLQDSGLVLGALDIMQGSPLPADEVFLAEVVGP